MKKFELTSEFITMFGKKLFRIKALISFGNVEAGELGGYVEKEENLSHDGNAWVCDDARVCGNAWVCGNARVCDDAWVYGNAWVCDDAWVCGNARVCDDAWVCGNAWVCDDAWVYGNARVCDDALLKFRSDILWVSNIGSRNDTTTFFKTKENKINVICGCFRGTIEQFEKVVEETHGGSLFEKQYKISIELAKTSILRSEQDD